MPVRRLPWGWALSCRADRSGVSACRLSSAGATGAAFSLYSSSLAMTEVVRAILLFYLTPVWGTLLGIAFLGERLTTPRLAALVLALIGLVVVLGGDGFPRPRSAGDWLALASGFSWALGALLVYRAEEAGPVEQVSAFIFGSLAVTLLTPGRVGILLMSDVIVAVITAAWFSGEPFGLREAAGTILIVSAAAVEVLDRAADTDT
jgi:drug/metabolite transporter (DMT)-like permease